MRALTLVEFLSLGKVCKDIEARSTASRSLVPPDLHDRTNTILEPFNSCHRVIEGFLTAARTSLLHFTDEQCCTGCGWDGAETL
jgi:hypothetical protein